jgi:hypothetical protein
MPRYGKIARLPRHLREELNRRIDNGEPGVRLVAWLNTLPEVNQVLESDFDGREISEQNLSEWKDHGFRKWHAHQDALALTRDVIANADELAKASGGALADSLAIAVAARYATALENCDGEISAEIREQLKALKSVNREVVRLRRSDQYVREMQIRRQWLELEKSRFEHQKGRTRPLVAQQPNEAGLTPDPQPISEEEKARRLNEHLFPRDLFPEKYQAVPSQGVPTPGENGTNQTISN